MKTTDVMLVFLMLLVWGQNYETKELIKQRVGVRATAACVRVKV